MTMPLCPCKEAYATVELAGAERVLVCEKCAALLEAVMRLVGTRAKRRPVLGIVPT